MGKTKVALDTNVLVSAFGWKKGNPHKILQSVVAGDIELFISREQFAELTRVLEYPKFNFSSSEKERFKSLISAIANFVEPKILLTVVEEDSSDNMILECAVAASVDYVISGDEHLLTLGTFRGIRILTASEFLRMKEF